MSATPHSITQPLNLRGYLRSAPQSGWDVIAVLDLALIAALLFLNHSRFVFAPGAEVDLVRTRSETAGTLAGTAVLTVERNGLLFFDGRKVTAATLQEALLEFTAGHTGEAVLLLKLDRSLSLEELFALFEIARISGFDRVQIAAESASAAETLPGMEG